MSFSFQAIFLTKLCLLLLPILSFQVPMPAPVAMPLAVRYAAAPLRTRNIAIPLRRYSESCSDTSCSNSGSVSETTEESTEETSSSESSDSRPRGKKKIGHMKNIGKKKVGHMKNRPKYKIKKTPVIRVYS